MSVAKSFKAKRLIKSKINAVQDTRRETLEALAIARVNVHDMYQGGTS